MSAVGLDVCKGGWIAVVLRPHRAVAAHFLTSISALASVVSDADGIAIDIPIGLGESGWRQADIAAKKVLGARSRSVFMTPVRAALEASTYREATAVSVALIGTGINRQAYALRSKIFEVEAWLPTAWCPVWEVHPELSFATLIGSPATSPKTTWAGMAERRRALAGAAIDLDSLRAGATGTAGTDDVLDAAAAAWSAKRLLEGTARSFPDPPELGAGNRQIAIWA